MATRTQIYLTQAQRDRIDQFTAAENVTLAEVVRRALDRFLDESMPDTDAALRSTFGSDPGATAPDRSAWSRG